jgi:hypothetical protein
MMTDANRTQWMRCVIFVGFLYAVVGISFAWPIITGVPALAVALVVTFVLDKRGHSA